MAYTPNQWATGDTITAAKLNNMESGIASAAMIITDTNGTLDKTFAEIYNAIAAGIPCYIKYNDNGVPADLDEEYTYYATFAPVVKVFKYNEDYRIYASDGVGGTISNKSNMGTPCMLTYSSNNSETYPVYTGIVYVPANYLAFSQYSH